MSSKTLEGGNRLFIVIASALPSFLCLFLLWQFDVSIYIILLFIFIQSIILSFCLFSASQKITNRFKMLANIIEGIDQGDYSIRIRQNSRDETLDQLARKINGLSQDLAQQKIATFETSSLLAKVISHIPIGVLTFNEKGNLGMINAAAIAIFANTPINRINDLPFEVSANKNKTLLDLKSGESKRRYYLQTDTFIDRGEQNQLLLLTDVDTVLRAEERKSWENLIRVISHEINNSLTPIASISESLLTILTATPELETTAHLIEPLNLVHERAKSLIKFISQTKHFSHLQQPNTQRISVSNILQPALNLFSDSKNKVEFVIEGDLNTAFNCDLHQLQLVCINLIKNAAEANEQAQRATPSQISIHISCAEHLHIEISDQGSGIANAQNLFVPFYTTKKNGSGIGLALSRNIVEAHKGSLNLYSNTSGVGATATMILPLR